MQEQFWNRCDSFFHLDLCNKTAAVTKSSECVCNTWINKLKEKKTYNRRVLTWQTLYKKEKSREAPDNALIVEITMLIHTTLTTFSTSKAQ